MIDDPQDPIPQDVAGALAKIRAQQPQPPADIGTALAKIRSGSHDFHAEYQSGALANRMAGANARDAANNADEDASQPGYGDRLATHVLNTAQGIPGVQAVEAGAGALGSRLPGNTPMSYRESLNALGNQTKNIGGKTSFAEKALGSLATAPFLPTGAVKAGAALGAADQALSADPDESLGQRAANTAVGAGVGGVAGKVVGGLAQGAVTGTRAALTTDPATNVIERQAARAASAAANYSTALAQGQGATVTPQIKAFLAEPDIAGIVDEIAQTRPFRGVARDGPEMLDQVYKTLSDQAAIVKKGQMALTPSRVNIGNLRGKDIGAAKSDLVDAVSGGTTMPGPMPAYRNAVQDYAKQSGELDAFNRGYDAQHGAVSGNVPSAKNLTRKTPQAFAEWAKTASPEELQAATEGILGRTKLAAGEPGKTFGPLRRAFGTAPTLLRSTGNNGVADAFQQFGIAGANSPWANP